METLTLLYSRFAEIPLIYPVYFFYGAAFLFLGVSISVKNLKESDLRIANSLWMLGAFGIAHGIHEWLELYRLVQGEHLTPHELYLVKLIILHLFILSFFFLLQFGLSLINTLARWPMKLLTYLPLVTTVSWVVFLWMNTASHDLMFLRQTELGVRRTLGISGMLVTAFGLVHYAREIKLLSKSVSKNFQYAGIAFFSYGFFGGVLSFFPIFNKLHLPLATLRGVSAAIIAYFIIRALNIFDIETRKKIEKQARRLVQAEKMSSLGKLAAGIAHEINNPLTNASLHVQMLFTKLKALGVDADILEKLEATEKDIDRAAVIAQELLLFSRQKDQEYTPLDIATLLESATRLIAYKLREVSIEKSILPASTIMGDQGKLEQVFINILSNAIESMPQGGTITIGSIRGNGLIQVHITDTGEGIAAENLPHIFDPFFTTKEIGSGTGLGLFICYGIIKQHRGSISVTSTVGKGTTVTIILPDKEHYEENTDR